MKKSLLLSSLFLCCFLAGCDNNSATNPVAVDLGLPSGIKWASFNVGATSPEEYGGYYAWGETEEKTDYSWETYKWCKGNYNTLTKYCTNRYLGTIDWKTTLESGDDVATAKWGGAWRMPTKVEIDELCNNCTWTWTTHNGVDGYQVAGPNGNCIFLPAAGYRNGSEVYYRGADGYYWSSAYSGDYGNHYACNILCLDDGNCNVGYDYRYIGNTVRPVCDSNLLEKVVSDEQELSKEYNINESHNKRKLRDIEFRYERDVFLYLNSYKFVSEDGDVITFGEGGRYMYVNNILHSTNLIIPEFRKNSALIISKGIYGRNTFMICLEDYSHYICDVNDNTIYEETGKFF